MRNFEFLGTPDSVTVRHNSCAAFTGISGMSFRGSDRDFLVKALVMHDVAIVTTVNHPNMMFMFWGALFYRT